MTDQDKKVAEAIRVIKTALIPFKEFATEDGPRVQVWSTGLVEVIDKGGAIMYHGTSNESAAMAFEML